MTPVILVSSLRHLPHHVHEVHLVFLAKVKHGMRIKLKKNWPTILALALFTMFRQDRNLKWKKRKTMIWFKLFTQPFSSRYWLFNYHWIECECIDIWQSFWQLQEVLNMSFEYNYKLSRTHSYFQVVQYF